MNLADQRRNYARAALDESQVAADPITQFEYWLGDAEAAGVPEANAMTLATADARGAPSARIVLLKSVDASGFVFFTDYRSRKGRELEANPHAALVFHWHELERQVRVVGGVERLDAAASWAYFRTRPLGSRLGAWASHQSAVLADRADLERQLQQVSAEYPSGEVPLPPYWGGFRVVPAELEFWQGRPDRLHDRIFYTRTSDNAWRRVRLSP